MGNNPSVNKQRRRVIKFASISGVSGLAGCISTDNNSNGGSSDEMADTFEFWESTEANVYEIPMERYEEEYSVEIDHTNMGQSDLEERFQTRLLSGSGAPDIALIEYTSIPPLIDTGGLRDLSSWIEDAGIEEDFLQGIMATVSQDGSIYALPEDTAPTAIFYRRDVFNEYNIDPDSIETWDQFIEEGEKLPDDIAMFSMPSTDYVWHWRYMFRQLEGEPFTEDGAVNIHSEKSLRVVQLLQQMDEAGILSHTGAFTQDWFSELEDGTLASNCMGAWFESTLRETLGHTAGDWGVMKLPAFDEGGNRASNWGGSGLVIPEQISEAAAERAWHFLENMFADPEIQALIYENEGSFPALTTAYDREVFEQSNEFFDGQQVGQLWTELAPDIPSYRYTADTPEIEEAMATHLRDVFNGNMEPEEAVNSAAEQVAERTGRDLA